VREIDLYEHGENVSAEELVHRITSAVAPETRAVALTWVHSSTDMTDAIERQLERFAPGFKDRVLARRTMVGYSAVAFARCRF
jgi:phytoene dehydrogenase-like protein